MPRRKSLIAIIAILIVATALTTAIATPAADASTPLRQRLRIAQRDLRHATERLQLARAALAAALAGTTDSAGTLSVQISPQPQATPAPASVDVLKTRVTKARRAVRRAKLRVRRVTRQVHQKMQMAAWERNGQWMPIIRMAAAKYHVNPDGMYRMMMRESGGRRTAGSASAFKGLFQYWTGTWSNGWNPWRHDSIYDGSSQIFATAYAIHKGMGPQMWTTTWASQY